MSIPEPPNAIEAEQAVIGSILLNRDAIIALASWLEPDMFYDARHAAIYSAARSLYERRVPPDTRTVAIELRKRNQFDAIGGLAYLAQLVDAAPTSYHVEHYARDVADAAAHRTAIELGGKIAALGYRQDLDTEALRAEIHSLTAGALVLKQRGGLIPIGDVMSALYDDLRRDATPAIPTRLADYDYLTGGLYPGHLIVPAGRPGHGKSALCKTIAFNVARAGHAVALFSLEMERLEIARRIVAASSGVDGARLRANELKDDDLTRVTRAMGEVSGYPLYLEDVQVSLADIRARALRHVAEHGPLALLIVDYLQLVTPSMRRGQNRAQEVGEISRGLKGLAKELRCTVMAPSQLNRAIEHRTNATPTLSDLRESGDVEQDADQVVFVVRPELMDPDSNEHGIARLYVAKHRDGPTGVVSLAYDKQTTCFRDLSQRSAA